MEFSTFALYSKLLEDTGVDRTYHPSLAWSPKEAARQSIAQSLLKKLRPKQSDRLDAAALLKFLDSNHRSRNWALQLNTSADEVLWGEFKSSIQNFWYADGAPLAESDTDLVALSCGRVGPGSAIGAVGGSFYEKMFSSKLTATRFDLYRSYRQYVSRFPYWSEAEQTRSDVHGELDIVEASRLDFVPKTSTISRCICVEPSLNMFLQLGVGELITRRLKQRFGIDLSVQPFRNKELARIGSIFDSNITIDLESASDSLGLKLCEEVLPKSMMSLLKRYRSPSTHIPGLGNFELDIISSMGNGFTFPLQTMMFAAMVEAAYRVTSTPFPRDFNHKEWGVFGDDIIVPKGKVGRCTLRLLALAGFRVNDSKSFFEGQFRESCGADYFNGHDVRGVYLKSFERPQDFLVAINQLNVFSMRTGILLPRTVQYLLRFAPKRAVPLHESVDAGIRMPLSIARSFSKLAVDQNGSVLYKAYVPVQRFVTFGESGMQLPRFLSKKPYSFNPLGAWTAFLQRSLVSYRIALRLKVPTYTTMSRVSPCWDSHMTIHGDEPWVPWQRLGDAVYFNLFM